MTDLQQVLEEILQLIEEWKLEPVIEERAKLEKDIMHRGGWLNTATGQWMVRMSDIRAYAASRGEE